MKILICGAGIGGLSLASFCEKTGIEYKIIEKQKDFSHHGYSIGLWSNARNMLMKLGLQDKFDKNAIPFKKFKLCDGSGKEIYQYNFGEFFQKYGMGYFHVHRKDLVNWLAESVRNEINFETTISKMEDDGRGVNVMFSGNKTERFDLVVACDGISSQIRNNFFGDDVRVYENWRTWFMWIDSKYVENKSIVEYVEPGSLIVVFYEGGDSALVTMTAKQGHKTWDDEVGRIERLKKLFKNQKTLVPNIFEGRDSSVVLPTNLSNIRLQKMYKGRIVLLGDAAHGFEPYAGMGASMAMEDAYVLVAELNKKESLDIALAQYEKKRLTRVREASKVTMRLKRILITESVFLRSILNMTIKFMPKSFFLNSYKKLLSQEI